MRTHKITPGPLARLGRSGRTTLALAALGLLAACSGSKQDRIDSGLKKGAEFVRLADWDKANVEVRNVLQIDPKNAQAYLINGQVSEGQRDIQRAYGAYSKAVELKPDLIEAQVGLARIYLMAGEIAKAQATVTAVLAADAGNAGGRTLHAALAAQAGKPKEAMAEAQAVIDGAKTVPVDASMVLAGLLSNEGRTAEALAVIDRALKAEPRNLGLLQVAALLAGKSPKGDPLATRADGYFKTATQEAPKNNELWRAWASMNQQRGDIEGTEAVLRQAVAALPGEGKRQLDLLNFLASSKGVAAAETEYTAAIAAKPRDMALRFGLVQLYQQANRPGDAQKVLRDIAASPDDAASQLSAKAQLANYAYAAGRIETTRSLVAEILKASPRDNAALLLRGRLSLQDGKAADAVQDLRPVAKDQPGSADVIGLLAQAHRAAGEPQLAREVLSEAVKLKPNDTDLRLLLVADLADAKDYRNALSELDAGLRATPNAVSLYEGKVKLAMIQKDSAGAEKALVALKTQLPQQSVGYVRLGQFYMQTQRYDAALKAYDAGAAAVANDLLPYISAVGLLVGTQRYDEATRRIEARQKGDATNVLHHQLKGDVAMAKRDYVAAEQAYRAAIQAAPKAPVGYLNTARALAARNDLDGAVAVLAEGEKGLPQDLAMPMARAEWLTRAKRNDEAIALYEKLNQREPDNDAVANNLAFLLAEIKGDRASLERALALAGRFANTRNAGYLDSLGWIHHKLGQYGQAVPLLEKAVALAPAAPLMQLHLGQSLVKNGQVAKGREYLKKAIDSKADLPNLQEAKALLAQG